jgi:plasmid stabilization system protein ParE
VLEFIIFILFKIVMMIMARQQKQVSKSFGIPPTSKNVNLVLASYRDEINYLVDSLGLTSLAQARQDILKAVKRLSTPPEMGDHPDEFHESLEFLARFSPFVKRDNEILAVQKRGFKEVEFDENNFVDRQAQSLANSDFEYSDLGVHFLVGPKDGVLFSKISDDVFMTLGVPQGQAFLDKMITLRFFDSNFNLTFERVINPVRGTAFSTSVVAEDDQELMKRLLSWLLHYGLLNAANVLIHTYMVAANSTDSITAIINALPDNVLIFSDGEDLFPRLFSATTVGQSASRNTVFKTRRYSSKTAVEGGIKLANDNIVTSISVDLRSQG